MDFKLVKQLKKINESHGYWLTWKDRDGKEQKKSFTIYTELAAFKHSLEKDGSKDIGIEVDHYGEDR